MKDKRHWSPYIAGVSLGLTLLAKFFIAGRGLGASGAMALVTAVGSHSLVPEFISKLKYFEVYITPAAPLLNWNIFLLGGLLLGALASSLLTGNFKIMLDRRKTMTIGTRLFTAFAGGMFYLMEKHEKKKSGQRTQSETFPESISDTVAINTR